MGFWYAFLCWGASCLPVQAAGAGDRVLGCIRPAGRRTKRDEFPVRNETKRERTNETKRMKRIEFSELPKLHAICNRWMHFFCSLLVVILGFWRACKKTSTAPSAHYFGSFFSCEKSQSFVAIWNDFPNLAQFFERPTLVDQSSANSSRLLTKLSGMLRFGVRFSHRTF